MEVSVVVNVLCVVVNVLSVVVNILNVVVNVYLMIQQKELGCVAQSVVSQTSNLTQVITLFSCSTELSMKLQMLI